MSALAARYARALAEVLREAHQNPTPVQSQLDDFVAAWNTSADLREVFLDPSFPVAEKVAILDKLNTKLQLTQQARNFVAVLINHGRLHDLREIVAAFHEVVDEELGVSVVAVTSARALGEDQRRDLEQQIAGMTQTKIRASYQEDASLLGGVIVRIGSTVYDGSVRGRLDRLKEELIAG
ncbi:ATP synthase F1 subunit delta [Silvibacterium dinghuense]|uniref:ATP synthase subunit delta n=1 Tax=Silvibacterium dinghuense TaxID=1560006 RepID=A0A4Q1SE37_9BACT|nr:ATP synthase F1 subunit delta [Silvibacterium dinghuense]RXS95512.1 ATP synthase F1 subunit delta [Silvibacterium dinghuense]GGH13676.1 ATP synthase subunit delta [Silvibacterium dinghuense]